MKLPLCLLIVLSFFNFSFKNMKEPIKVVFFGDSITEAGAGPGGYISHMRDMLAQARKDSAYELIGKGIGGNKVYDLYLRLEDDVLALKPDVVFIYVGVNDVWHKRTHGTGTDADKFVRFYQALINKMQAQGIKVILCTPACIGEKWDYTNPLDGEINQYAQLIRDLAKTLNLPVVDLRRTFWDYLSQRNPQNAAQGILTTDGVHLNELGNRMVAEKMLKELMNVK